MRYRMETVTALCQKCATRFESFEASTDKELQIDYHLTIAELQLAADGGCVLCSPAWESLQSGYYKHEYRDFQTATDRKLSQHVETTGRQDLVRILLLSGSQYSIQVAWHWKDYDIRSFSSEFRSPRRTLTVFNFDVFETDIHEVFRPGSSVTAPQVYDALVAQIGMWLTQDLELHHQINVRAHASVKKWCPRRLVEIIDSKLDRVRVIDTRSSKTVVPYVALSHRWPSEAFFKSLRSNVAELQGHSGIPLKSLSLTFQDAIGITRDIGLRHVWIDSLCIIQDDPDDWNAEALKMADVYGNAQLTLAFNTDPEDFQSPVQLLSKILSKAVSNARPNYFLDRDGFEYSFPDLCLEECLLASRGWCYQERLLSKRLVHLFPSHVLWERVGVQDKRFASLRDPSTYMKVEAPAGDLDYESYEEVLLDIVVGRVSQIGRGHDVLFSLIPMGIFETWAECIRTYTKRQLTQPDDRLVAFSAVTRKFVDFTGDVCIFGCFARSLVRCLEWRCMEAETLSRRTQLNGETCRVPSWSWGSVNGNIDYAFVESSSDTVKTDMAWMDFYRPADGSQIGTWKDTKAIKLYGILLPARLSWEYDSCFMSLSDNIIRTVFGFPPNQSEVSIPHVDLDIRRNAKSADNACFLLPTHAHTYDSDLDVDLGDDLVVTIQYQGLLLKHSAQYPGAYERNGYVNFVDTFAMSRQIDLDPEASCLNFQRSLQQKKLEHGIEFLLV